MAQPNAVFSLGGPPPNFTFPLPLSTTDPDEEPLVYVRLNREWLKYLIGACYALRQEATWLSDDYSLVSLSIARANMLLDMLMTELCEPVCADEIRIAGNALQLSEDGGETWANVPNAGAQGDPPDPRTDEPLLPHRTGENIPCLAAANATACLVELHRQVVAWYDANLSGLVLLGALALILGVLFPVSWMVFGLSLSSVTLSITLLTYSAVLNNAAFTEAVQEELTCILYCNADENGQWDAAALALIMGQIALQEGDIWRLLEVYFEQIAGPNGLNNAGTTTSVDAYDCGECACNWCYTFDFATTDGDFDFMTNAGMSPSQLGVFTPPFEVSSNQGIEFPNNWWKILGIQRAFSANVTRIEMDITVDRGDTIVAEDVQIWIFDGGSQIDNLQNVETGAVVWTGDHDFTDFKLEMEAGFKNNSTVPTSQGRLNTLTLWGAGENPFGGDNC